jgi:[ribosomal protein S5]-alanine N-acetyltransferase
MLIIKNTKFLLRDHVIEDLDNFHRWISDDEVMKYVYFGKTSTREESFIKLSEAIQENISNNRTKYFFAAELIESHENIGECGITIEKKETNGGIGNMGYFLLKEYWGKGYATEIAKLLIDFGFNELKLHKIIASCDSENRASERVMIKCGMIKEATLKYCRYSNGIWKDELQYAVYKKEYTF